MRIVNIEDFFHPDNGYQVNILVKFFARFGHEVTVITSDMEKMPSYLTAFFGKENIEERDKAFEREYGVKIIRQPIWKYISGRSIYKGNLLKTIKSCKPDILFVHGNDTATGMWALLNRKRLGCPLIMDNHMCEMASKNSLHNLFRKFYRKVFTPIIVKNHLVVVATSSDRFAEKVLGIPRELSPLISFGSDITLFHPAPELKTQFRKENGIPENSFVVLYAGKLDETKGGKLLADLTCEKLKTDREITYIIIGNSVGEYGEEIEKEFSKSPYRVLRYPTQKYCDLAQFYQAADVALIPKQCSLSVFDLNASGVPVIAEDNIVNIERCGHDNGWTFHAGELADLREKLEMVVNMPQDALREISKESADYIKSNFDYEDKAREFEREILNAVARAGKA